MPLWRLPAWASTECDVSRATLDEEGVVIQKAGDADLALPVGPHERVVLLQHGRRLEEHGQCPSCTAWPFEGGPAIFFFCQNPTSQDARSPAVNVIGNAA